MFSDMLNYQRFSKPESCCRPLSHSTEAVTLSDRSSITSFLLVVYSQVYQSHDDVTAANALSQSEYNTRDHTQLSLIVKMYHDISKH